MRRNDLNGGSIKALIILVLIIANLAAAALQRSQHVPGTKSPNRTDEIRMTTPHSTPNDHTRRKGVVSSSSVRPPILTSLLQLP
jgi:hypothetical protein